VDQTDVSEEPYVSVEDNGATPVAYDQVVQGGSGVVSVARSSDHISGSSSGGFERSGFSKDASANGKLREKIPFRFNSESSTLEHNDVSVAFLYSLTEDIVINGYHIHFLKVNVLASILVVMVCLVIAAMVLRIRQLYSNSKIIKQFDTYDMESGISTSAHDLLGSNSNKRHLYVVPLSDCPKSPLAISHFSSFNDLSNSQIQNSNFQTRL